MSTVPTRTTADAVLADAPRADDDALLGCLHIITRLYGRPVSESALVAALPLRQEALTAADYVRAAENHGYTVRLARRRLGRIPALLLPATLILRDSAACVLTRQLPGARYEVVFPEAGPGPRTVGLAELEQSYSGYVLFTQPSAPAGGVAAAPGVGRRRSWFWGVLAAYSPYYLEAALSALLVNVLSVATALYIMNVYDRVVPNSAFATLLVLAFGTALAVGFEFCARTLRAYFLDAAGRKADLVLSSQIFAQAMGLRMATRPGSTGAFAAQIREFESVREFITSATLTALMDIPFVAFFIFIVYLIGGPIYLVPFLAVPLIVLIGLLAQWPLARTMNTNLREAAQRHGLLIESLEGMESVKALRAEGYLRGRYEDSCAHVGRSAHQARTISALVVNFTAATLQMVTVGMVFWGVYLIDAGELTVGALVACVMLIGRGLAPLQQVAALMMRYQQARAAYFTLQGLMGQPVERPTGKAYTHREAVQGALAMQDVHFTYPGSQQESLQGATFEIEAGEHVAILGRVGSGKSTLLRLLLGLFEPARGTVLLDGVDIAQFDPADLRRHLGYATQDANLFSGTLRENIALGQPHAADEAILEAVRIAGLAEFVAGHPAGLQRPVGERGQALSGGQRQAVAIARTLLLEPRVLLLDEPTSAMDHSTEQRFIGELARYAQGRTMLLVTHKPSMLVLAKRILVLDAGRVVMDGPRDEILRALTRPVEQQA